MVLRFPFVATLTLRSRVGDVMVDNEAIGTATCRWFWQVEEKMQAEILSIAESIEAGKIYSECSPLCEEFLKKTVVC